MKHKPSALSPGTKCECGHRYSEHVQGGDRHACQHGAEPPFKNMCTCNRFRPKEDARASAKGQMPDDHHAAAPEVPQPDYSSQPETGSIRKEPVG